MTIRHAPLAPGATAWLDFHLPYENTGLVDHARVRVLTCDRAGQTTRVRIEEGPQTGREVQLLHWQVVRWQYEVNGRWLDESEPEVLIALANHLAKARQKTVPASVETAHLKYISDLERILTRNGWKV